MRHLLLGSPLLFRFTGVVFWAMQGRLNTLGVPAAWVGVALSAYFLPVAALAELSGRMLDRLGETRLACLLPLMMAGGTLPLALSDQPVVVWLGGVLGAGAVHAIGRPFCVCLINREVADGERATTLSLGSMVSTLNGGAMMLGVWQLMDVLSLPTVLLGFMSLTLLLAGYPMLKLCRG